MARKSAEILALKNDKFELNVDILKSILLLKELENRDIVAISIAGAFRTGKSFLLNFILRYMNETYVKKTVDEDWLYDEDKHLDGFKWAGGIDPVTCGIQMWNEVFFHDFVDGRKVAIVFIDTQGTFDHKTTLKDCTMIFALSTLLSSVQIFNIMHSIQENDLQHLQLFAEFGRLAADNLDCKPFQKLLFLVRDWRFPCDHQYGSDGGLEYLQKCFDCSNNKEEHRVLRDHIQGCFDDISCYLMAHPGFEATESPNFNGRSNEISQNFKDHLRLLIPQILAPENLTVKKINGRALKSQDFIEYFEQYFNAFKNDIPSPMTIMDANAKVHNNRIIRDIELLYFTKMTSIECSLKHYLDELEKMHELAKPEAFELFKINPLMGSTSMETEYENELENYIRKTYKELLDNHEHNEVELMEIERYYTVKVRKFDAELERYLDLLGAEHEIGKRKSLETLSEKLVVKSPTILKIFKSDLIDHIGSDYQLLIQDFKSNEESLRMSEESYSARLALFHCGIDQYIEKLRIEHKIAKERATELLQTNFLRGNSKLVARFKGKLQDFFHDQLEWFIKMHKYSLEVIEESRKTYLARMLDVHSNSWMYVRSLKKKHVAAKLEALQLFERKMHIGVSRMCTVFKQRLETLIENHLQGLLDRSSAWNLFDWPFRSWSVVNTALATSATAAGILIVAPLEIPLLVVTVASGIIAGAVAYITRVDYSYIWRRFTNRSRQLTR